MNNDPTLIKVTDSLKHRLGKTSRQGLLFLLAFATLAASGIQAAAAPSSSETAQSALLAQSFGNRPLSFEANQGQTDSEVQFLSRGPGYSLFLTPTEAVLSLRKAEAQPARTKLKTMKLMKPTRPKPASAAVLRMQLEGANAHVKVEGIGELPGKTHYLRGKDPKAWRTGIPSYARVKYHGVYPGVDLVYYGKQRQLEYDFVVAPGADPKTIRLRFDGVEQLSLDSKGQLVVKTPGGDVIQHKPVIYQEIGGVRKEVAGGYVLSPAKKDKTPLVGFRIAQYNISKPLIIDPVLAYSTYLGGSIQLSNDGDDSASSIAVDAFGNAYVTGNTDSSDFPVVNSEYFGNPFFFFGDAFVTKFDPKGAVIYSTVFGGSIGDGATGIAVDRQGNAYVTGSTGSNDFPTLHSIEDTCAEELSGISGSDDAYVTKFSPDGSSIIYSTCFGGSSSETGHAIDVDRTGNAYVTGTTSSIDFPTVNPVQASSAGGQGDIFIVKLHEDGGSFKYATYLGGSGGNVTEVGRGIVADRFGNAYVTGTTSSEDFPTVRAFQPVYGGGDLASDAFVAKLNARGNVLMFSTYLGGNGSDQGRGIAVDRFGNAFVTGWARSSDFPTVHSIKSCDEDAFVAKLRPFGGIVYSTCLGGTESDLSHAIDIDRFGNAYVTGQTNSTNFPLIRPLTRTCANEEILDAFVAKLNSKGSRLVYSTCLGGRGNDVGNGIAVDRFGSAYVAGSTGSIDFPTVNAFQPTPPGVPPGDENAFISDAFVTKIVGN
jgi:hypothetical protein